MVTHWLVVSYTTFSPLLPQGGGRSLLPKPAVTDSFYFRKWRALCCPDFPLADFSASDRPDYCLRPTKLVQAERKTKDFVLFFTEAQPNFFIFIL